MLILIKLPQYDVLLPNNSSQYIQQKAQLQKTFIIKLLLTRNYFLFDKFGDSW